MMFRTLVASHALAAVSFTALFVALLTAPTAQAQPCEPGPGLTIQAPPLLGVANAIAYFDTGDGQGPRIVAAGLLQLEGVPSPVVIQQGETWTPLGSLTGTVQQLASRTEDGVQVLYAVGSFTINGMANVAVARYDGTWNVELVAPGEARVVLTDTPFGELVVGGDFFFPGLSGVRARVNGVWTILSGRFTDTNTSAVFLPPGVHALAVMPTEDGDRLVAAGRFNGLTGSTETFASVAVLENGTWRPLGAGLLPADYFAVPYIRSLKVFDDGTGPALFASGAMNTVQRLTGQVLVAKLVGDNWTASFVRPFPVVAAGQANGLGIGDTAAGGSLYVITGNSAAGRDGLYKKTPTGWVRQASFTSFGAWPNHVDDLLPADQGVIVGTGSITATAAIPATGATPIFTGPLFQSVNASTVETVQRPSVLPTTNLSLTADPLSDEPLLVASGSTFLNGQPTPNPYPITPTRGVYRIGSPNTGTALMLADNAQIVTLRGQTQSTTALSFPNVIIVEGTDGGRYAVVQSSGFPTTLRLFSTSGEALFRNNSSTSNFRSAAVDFGPGNVPIIYFTSANTLYATTTASTNPTPIISSSSFLVTAVHAFPIESETEILLLAQSPTPTQNALYRLEGQNAVPVQATPQFISADTLFTVRRPTGPELYAVGTRLYRWDRTAWTDLTGSLRVGSSSRVPAVAGRGDGGYSLFLNEAGSGVVEYILCPLPCSADFNNDGDAGMDDDLEAFFACLAGDCCPACGTADIDQDGDVGTDADIEAFFRVLGGQPC